MIKKSEKGYIALTSAIILGITLLVAVLGFAIMIFFNKKSTTQAILKEASYFTARACLEKALLNLTADSTYSGGEYVSVDNDQCTISSVTQNGENFVIIAVSTVNRNKTTLELTVDGMLNTISFIER